MFAARRNSSGLDLEAVEMATRAGLHRAGAAVLTGLLTEDGAHAARVTCACGKQAHYHDRRPKQLLTVLGSVQLDRDYYVCPDCELHRRGLGYALTGGPTTIGPTSSGRDVSLHIDVPRVLPHLRCLRGLAVEQVGELGPAHFQKSARHSKRRGRGLGLDRTFQARGTSQRSPISSILNIWEGR